MKQVKLRRIGVNQIGDDLRKQMYTLFDTYYVNVKYHKFAEDLGEKDHVLTMWHRNGHDNKLIGFSTVMRKFCSFPEPHVTIFSGDTVIHQDFWGRKDLQKAFFWYILETKLIARQKPVYWFLISKGHKTYLMMRKNFPHSFPNHKQNIPGRIKAIMDHYYKGKFQGAYCRDTNLIRFQTRSDATKHEYLDIKKDVQNDPDGAYFFKANPDFEKGTELACVAEIRWGEFYHHVKKFFLKGLFTNPFKSFRAIPHQGRHQRRDILEKEANTNVVIKNV